jgi:hypothetical protein
MSGVDAYVQQVDRVLAGARALFPDDGGGVIGAAEEPAGPLVAPDESSGLGSTVAQASTGYHGDRSRAGDISAEAAAAAAAARVSADEAGGTAVGIRQTAAVHAAAVGPETGSPEAVVLLVTRMDERLAQMQEHIAASRTALADAAKQVRAHGDGLAALGHG